MSVYERADPAHSPQPAHMCALTRTAQADVLVGVGTSGVSQLIAQMIGGRNRVDGNALSLWQEDMQAIYSSSSAAEGCAGNTSD